MEPVVREVLEVKLIKDYKGKGTDVCLLFRLSYLNFQLCVPKTALSLFKELATNKRSMLCFELIGLQHYEEWDYVEFTMNNKTETGESIDCVYWTFPFADCVEAFIKASTLLG